MICKFVLFFTTICGAQFSSFTGFKVLVWRSQKFWGSMGLWCLWFFCLLDDHGDDAYHVMAGWRHFDWEITSWNSWKVVGRINVSGSNLESNLQYSSSTAAILHLFCFTTELFGHMQDSSDFCEESGDNLCLLLGLIFVVAMRAASIFKMASKLTPKQLGYTMPGIERKS